MVVLLRRLAADPSWVAAARREIRGSASFRVMLSDGDRLTRGDSDARKKLICTIEQHCGLRHAPRGGGIEFWLLRRRTGRAYFCVRLTQRRATEKTLAQGELRPELAQLLCELSEPAAGDVFLDPFAGTGAIVFARVGRPYNIAFAFEKDAAKAGAIRRRAKQIERRGGLRGGPVVARVEDARTLDTLRAGFVDRVVTDPPWGHFDPQIADLRALYEAAFRAIVRVTRVGGVVVMLLGRTDDGEEIVGTRHRGLELMRRFDILVSGRKALVAKWRRSGRDS